MKERPVLFNGAMVRAILDGRKTQTRRIVKQKYLPWLENTVTNFLSGKWNQRPLPYGKPGDRMWVRETWQGPVLDEEQQEQWREDGPGRFKKPEFCVYRATDTLNAVDEDGKELCWRPSIHMPRWASRIDLEITGVRVERLQDISEADALAEGVMQQPGGWFSSAEWQSATSARAAYALLWESINGTGSWDANPWVWVIDFRRIKP